MTGSTKNIVKQLFHASSLEAVSVTELEALVAANPVFSAGHYLLSKKLLQDGAASFTRQTQKTALYFSNPFWLHWLLKNVKDDHTENELETVPQPHEREYPSWPVTEIREEASGIHEVQHEAFSSGIIEDTPPETEVETGVEPAADVPEKPEELKSSFEEIEKTVNDTEVVATNEIHNFPTETPGDLPANKATEADEIGGHISKLVTQQAEDAAKEIKPETLAFEPYHTIDYFASQGIKFIQENNPADKLGRQLKSFTEWLKVMKKLPRQTADQSAVDETAQANIDINAAESIQGKEVVTEAMAEVLIKQGKTEKAADVYRKLSLLNPDKSVYFAARIEQLKVH